MFAARSISRLAPRAAGFASSRTISTARIQPSTLRSAWKKPAAFPRLTAAFSRSAASRQDADLQTELVAKLESELQLEKEMKEYNETPVSVKDYLENGPFKVGTEILHRDTRKLTYHSSSTSLERRTSSWSESSMARR